MAGVPGSGVADPLPDGLRMTHELVQMLDLEGYVLRRIWASQELSTGAMAPELVGIMTIFGVATWRWRFRNCHDLMLLGMVWA